MIKSKDMDSGKVPFLEELYTLLKHIKFRNNAFKQNVRIQCNGI